MIDSELDDEYDDSGVEESWECITDQFDDDEPNFCNCPICKPRISILQSILNIGGDRKEDNKE